MFKYRDYLYTNYYSNHAGKTNLEQQKPHFEQQKRYLTKELFHHLPSEKNIRILDVGCGSGSLVQALVEAGYSNVEGIDLSEEQIKMAKYFGVEHVTCTDADSFLASKEEEFDVILAVDVLEHLAKDEAVAFLLNIKKALKKGGQFVFRCPNMDSPQASAFAHADITHELFLNKSSALQLLRSVGYSQTDIFPSYIFIENPLKEIIRKFLFSLLRMKLKFQLFATGRTWDKMVFTPNLLGVAFK